MKNGDRATAMAVKITARAISLVFILAPNFERMAASDPEIVNMIQNKKAVPDRDGLLQVEYYLLSIPTLVLARSGSTGIISDSFATPDSFIKII